MHNFIKAKIFEKNLQVEDVLKCLDIPLSTYYYKINNNSWTPMELNKLSELFGCSIDYLVKGE